ncbi:MAG: methylated-DNA--[protein]-cysteine S-methyltransferase [Gammaproteobacteria bacterium]
MKPGAHRYQAVIAAPYGRLGVCTAAGRLQAIDFLGADAALLAPSDDFAQEVARQLQAYERDPCYRFRLALDLQGTPFQQRVWSALRAIPPGRTRTYGDLARELGSAPRAIGAACRANPVPVVVPCHRVVARTGIGGFGGQTEGPELARKRWLLAHEGAAEK